MRGGTEITQMLKKAGFELLRKNKHEVWGCPCGHALITVAATGDGKGSAAINIRTRLARTLKTCEQQEGKAA